VNNLQKDLYKMRLVLMASALLVLGLAAGFHKLLR